MAFAPALRDDGIFEDRNHETGITSVSDRDFFQVAGDDSGDGESATLAERSAVEFFDGAADGDFFERCGREIDAAVFPACLCVYLFFGVLDFLRVTAERVAEA